MTVENKLTLQRYEQLADHANGLFTNHLWNRFEGGESMMIAAMIAAAVMLNCDEQMNAHEVDDSFASLARLARSIYAEAKQQQEAARRLQ